MGISFASGRALLILSADSRELDSTKIKRHKNMNTKSPDCWASDPQARGLRIEISAEHTLVLPFEQFVFSEMERHEREQRLKLTFATHEVLICGTCLRRIETAVQRMELSYVGRLPDRYRQTIEEGQPFVREISVTG